MDGGHVIATDKLLTGIQIVKIDPEGNLEWTKLISGGWLGDIEATRDGGFILSSTAGIRHDALDIFLIKFDANANAQWAKTFGDGGYWSHVVARQTSSGAYIAATSTDYFGMGLYDIWVLKLDESGVISPSCNQWIGLDASVQISDAPLIQNETNLSQMATSSIGVDATIVFADVDISICTQCGR